MTSFSRPKSISSSVDDAFLAPWIATGVVDAQDARLFAAAMVSDPALADDLAAARAEQVAVVAMGAALGRPSMRPMLALFAAIDAESRPARSNVTRLTFARTPALPFDPHQAIDLRGKKISRRR